MSGLRYSREIKRAAIRLYRSGLTTYQVADSIGCSGTAVKSWLADAGVRVRKAGVQPVPLPPHREVERLMAQFRSMRVVAHILGCAYSTVRRRLMAMRARDARLRALITTNAGAQP